MQCMRRNTPILYRNVALRGIANFWRQKVPPLSAFQPGHCTLLLSRDSHIGSLPAWLPLLPRVCALNHASNARALDQTRVHTAMYTQQRVRRHAIRRARASRHHGDGCASVSPPPPRPPRAPLDRGCTLAGLTAARGGWAASHTGTTRECLYSDKGLVLLTSVAS